MMEIKEKVKHVPLGQLLIDNQKISPSQLDIALAEQKKTRFRLGHTLLDLEFINEIDLLEVLEKQFGIPAIKINVKMLNQKIVKIIPEYICRKYKLIPILFHDNKLTIAATNPYNMEFQEEIKFTTDHNTEIVLSPESSVMEAIKFSYGEKAEGTAEDHNKIDQGEMKARISAGKIMESIFDKAVKRKANEIHLALVEDQFNVQYINLNSTVTTETYPDFYYKTISLQLKTMANLDPEIKSFQEGMLNIILENKHVFLRALVFPNPLGENIKLIFP